MRRLALLRSSPESSGAVSGMGVEEDDPEAEIHRRAHRGHHGGTVPGGSMAGFVAIRRVGNPAARPVRPGSDLHGQPQRGTRQCGCSELRMLIACVPGVTVGPDDGKTVGTLGPLYPRA